MSINNSQKEPLFYGWRVVAGLFVAQLFVIGFFTYTVSLLVTPVRQEFGASVEQVMYSLTLATFLSVVFLPIAGSMVDKLAVRWLMVTGSLIFSIGLWGLSVSDSLNQYIVIFAVTMALTNSLAGSMSSSAVVSRWFTVSRGKALGVAAAGTSVGGLVVPQLVNGWLIEAGWRSALQNLSLVIVFVLLPVLLLLVRGKPSDMGLQPEADSSVEQGTISTPEGNLLTMADILRMPAFWFIGLSLGLMFSAYTAILSNLAPYATQLGQSEVQAAQLIMVVAVSGFVGKILFGIAADKMSHKVGLWTAQFLVFVGFLLLASEPGFAGMVLATTAMGLAAGGMLPVWGAMMAEIFGLLSYGRAMGLVSPLITLCVMPGFALAGKLYDKSGSYTLALLIFSGVIVVAALLLIPLKLQKSEN